MRIPVDETSPKNEDTYDFMQAIQNEVDRMASLLDKEMYDVIRPYDEDKSTTPLATIQTRSKTAGQRTRSTLSGDKVT